jgi:3-deoxy-D-manno-octulosonic-acid transferase
MTLPLILYAIGTAAVRPLLPLWLRFRVDRGKEDPARLNERYGLPSKPAFDAPTLHIHAASVGESLTVLPLIERLTWQGFCVIVTSGTRSSAKLLQERLPPRAVHQYAPLDVPLYRQRFLEHWQPRAQILVESEIWPHFLLTAQHNNVPVLLINARLSQRSFARWQRLPQTGKRLLGCLHQILAQTHEDAARWQKLGGADLAVGISGNLKFDVPPLPVDPHALEMFAAQLGLRPVFVAASTHPGEDEMILAAHAHVLRNRPDALCLLVPRHPERGDRVVELARRLGFVVAQRHHTEEVTPQTQVYVADTIGEMGIWYRLASMVFLGGSLKPHGGQNPIEPAKLGAMVLHGPYTHNFAMVYQELLAARASVCVNDAASLAKELLSGWSDAVGTTERTRAAQEVVQRLGGALAMTLQHCLALNANTETHAYLSDPIDT